MPGALQFTFQRSMFDSRAFSERIHRALRRARDESARSFLREMYRFFSEHTWSGAAQATLVPLSQAVKAVFAPSTPTWDSSYTGWKKWHTESEGGEHQNWRNQHGPAAGQKLGTGITSEYSRGGELGSSFLYGHALLHFTQGTSPHHWTILEDLKAKLQPEFIAHGRRAFRAMFPRSGKSHIIKSIQEVRV